MSSISGEGIMTGWQPWFDLLHICVLLGCVWLKNRGPWFSRWFNQLPGPSIFPKKAPMFFAVLNMFVFPATSNRCARISSPRNRCPFFSSHPARSSVWFEDRSTSGQSVQERSIFCNRHHLSACSNRTLPDFLKQSDEHVSKRSVCAVCTRLGSVLGKQHYLSLDTSDIIHLEITVGPPAKRRFQQKTLESGSLGPVQFSLGCCSPAFCNGREATKDFPAVQFEKGQS